MNELWESLCQMKSNGAAYAKRFFKIWLGRIKGMGLVHVLTGGTVNS